MPAQLDSTVINTALTYVGAQCDEVTLCGPTEPTNYTEAHTTYKLGRASNGGGFTAPVFPAPTTNGNNQRITSTTIANAPVEATGNAVWVCYNKTTATAAMLAKLSMTSQTLTNGNTWSMAASTIDVPRL